VNINREQAEAEFEAGLMVPVAVRMSATAASVVIQACQLAINTGSATGPTAQVLNALITDVLAGKLLIPFIQASIEAERRGEKVNIIG
jgi:hypothetical protein